MSKPLIANLPYPTSDGICQDYYSLKIIQSAYASPVGELNAIMQYSYHAICFECSGMADISHEINSIAIAEMMHFNAFGKLIYRLGAQPIFTVQPPIPFNFYSAKFVNYTTNLKHMLEDDIISEKNAIKSYEHMLKKLKNERVKEIVDRILIDEKLHLKRLNELYVDIKH